MSAERPDTTRTLLLLRHGRTAWNNEQRAQGHADIGLDDVGVAQARAVAPVLAALRPAFVVSSDLARACDTAREVASASGLTASADPRLREFDLGERTGMTMPEYAAAHPDEYAAFRAGAYDVVPAGESLGDVLARFLPALDDAFARLRAGETGIVVAHGAALKVAVLAWLGWPESLAASLRGLDNCRWAAVDDSGQGGSRRLVSYNAGA
ncbi:histidine phosphatase family protein [Nocardioides sp. LHG3406-4]|uniref:histidine phosphatase family protein n=1 Tax=Nocardioides sp. LHG3406-4 TaxID=2804575 RepID=UPI003CEC45F7